MTSQRTFFKNASFWFDVGDAGIPTVTIESA
jgi:hypothetical protein